MRLPFFYNNLNFIDIGEALAMQFHVHEIFCKKKKRGWVGGQHMRDRVCLLSNMHIEYDCHLIHLVFDVTKTGFIKIYASQC